MQPSVLLTFLLACLVLYLVPGPGMMFILANGIAGGRRAGVVAAFGAATGTVVYTIAAALGLSALLHAAPMVLDAVRIAGALFLVYLAITTLRSSRLTMEAADTVRSGRSLRRTYVLAVLTNLANPKVILFYFSFIPQFLTIGGWPASTQILVLGALLCVGGLVTDCAYGVFAGTLSELLRRRPSVRRWLNRVSAAVFCGLAVRLVADA